MALKKLQIIVEKKGATLVFEQSSAISVLFNPNKLVFDKSVNWPKQGAAQCDVPELQFTNAEGRTLNLDLIFDTYDTPNAEKEDVRTHTQKLVELTTVAHDKHRPPVCRLFWGKVFFQGILEKLEQQFTLFMEDGTPVRATARCTFKEWRTNEDDLKWQATQSSDIAKARIVKRGETLSSIAAEEYNAPRLWRPIAAENDIDDPRNVSPGTVLLIPTLTRRNATDRY